MQGLITFLQVYLVITIVVEPACHCVMASTVLVSIGLVSALRLTLHQIRAMILGLQKILLPPPPLKTPVQVHGTSVVL